MEQTIIETLNRATAEAAIDSQGNMHGVIVVEGESLNGNIYTRAALESGIEVFADQPIYADHPSRVDEQVRPERSVRDLVGRLPGREGLTVETLTYGPHAGKNALIYRGAKLSETAGWLRTLVQEGIAGDMSINATGEGREENNAFIVEAFVTRPGRITSLDFVTTAAAGGAATLVESARPAEPETTEEVTETVNQPVAEPVPAQWEASGEIIKIVLNPTKEVCGMTKELRELREAKLRVATLEAALKNEQRQTRQGQADKIMSEALASSGLPAKAQTRVKQVVEATIKQFVEQIELPTVTLPADVEALPDEVKAVWTQCYFGCGVTGEAAAYKAWGAVFDAFDHQDNGNWTPKAAPEGEMPEGEPPMEAAPVAPEGEKPEGDGAPTEDKMKPEEEAACEDGKKPVMSAASLQASIRQAILSERAYLAEVSGAGRVKGMGSAPAPKPEAITEANLEEAFAALLPEKEAKLAAAGR